MSESKESYVLIIDNSSSALASLDTARQAAQMIRTMSGDEQIKVFMLNGATPVSPLTLKQAIPPGINPQSHGCSLISPIMKKLVNEGQKRLVTVIGNGEIFDLGDWTDDPEFAGWLLVRTGDQSLQGKTQQISEISVKELPLNEMDVFPSYFTRATRRPIQTTNVYDRLDRYEWRVDPAGYPIILVEPLNAYVHLFPITKPQFEKFLSDDSGLHLDDDWYAEILALNSRASYRQRDIPRRENLLMTGASIDETIAFGRWLGRNYQLLTVSEWYTAYTWLAENRASLPPADLEPSLSRDAIAIWNVVEREWLDSNGTATLQDLAMMTRGILEWVTERSGKYCAVGEPDSTDLQRKPNDPVYPLGPEPRRLKNLGFRLCMRNT